MLILLAMIDNAEDKKTFEQIYMQNRDFMFNYTYRILGDEASTEDAVHDAFLSLAKNYDRYKHLDSNQMRSFLTITVRNAAFRIYNHRKRENVTEELSVDIVWMEYGTLLRRSGQQTDGMRYLVDGRELHLLITHSIRTTT